MPISPGLCYLDHAETSQVAMKLIIGLGNPGREHAANRHNVGFQCLDRLAKAHGLAFNRIQSQAAVAIGDIAGQRVCLAKPRTWMNASGLAVASLQRFYKVPLSDLIVVYDDLDLPQGKLRLRPDGGHGGHNGMRSIIEQLGSTAFPRLRIGIGRPPGHMDPVDYVLQDFSADEEAYMEEVRERAVRALECWLQDGIVAAMNRYNTNGAMGEGKG